MVIRLLLAGAVLIASAATSAAQSIQLTLRDGRVTLITQNATPAAILAEWARQGQVRIVDGERVPGSPLTLRLENVPEREALDIVLRSAAGFIAAPRNTPLVGTQSRFDRVMVMPVSPGASLAARNTTAPPAAVAPPAQAVVDRVTQADGGASIVQADPVADGGAEQPASSTDFDYANPQRYFATRQAQQAAGAAAAQTPQVQPEQPAGTTTTPFGVTRTTPGVLPVPQAPATNQPAPPINPYGLPASQSPGSQQPPPSTEPDRGKYMNPYAPTTPRP